jgi:hypothetical protein
VSVYVSVSVYVFVLTVRAVAIMKAKAKTRAEARAKAGMPGPPVALLTSPSPKKPLRKILSRSLTSSESIMEDGGLAPALLGDDTSLRNNIRTRSCSEDGPPPSSSSSTLRGDSSVPSQARSKSLRTSVSGDRQRSSPKTHSRKNFKKGKSYSDAEEALSGLPVKEQTLQINKFTAHDKPSLKLNFATNGGEMIGDEGEGGAGYLEVNVAKAASNNSSGALTPSRSWRDLDEDETVEKEEEKEEEEQQGKEEQEEEDGDDEWSDDEWEDGEDTFDAEGMGAKQQQQPPPLAPKSKMGPSVIDVLATQKKLDIRKTRIRQMTMIKLGYSDDDDDDSSSVFSSGDEDDLDEDMKQEGNRSCDISDALHLSNHIIVFGCSSDNLLVFIADLRWEWSVCFNAAVVRINILI